MSETVIPKLLSAREVAKATGLSVWSLYDLARQHRIPHRRLGRKVVFTAESLTAFLQGSDVPLSSERPTNGDAPQPRPARARKARA
jgi:excisionase family DNA binding protein